MSNNVGAQFTTVGSVNNFDCYPLSVDSVQVDGVDRGALQIML